MKPDKEMLVMDNECFWWGQEQHPLICFHQVEEECRWCVCSRVTSVTIKLSVVSITVERECVLPDNVTKGGIKGVGPSTDF